MKAVIFQFLVVSACIKSFRQSHLDEWEGLMA